MNEYVNEPSMRNRKQKIPSYHYYHHQRWRIETNMSQDNIRWSETNEIFPSHMHTHTHTYTTWLWLLTNYVIWTFLSRSMKLILNNFFFHFIHQIYSSWAECWNINKTNWIWNQKKKKNILNQNRQFILKFASIKWKKVWL